MPPVRGVEAADAFRDLMARLVENVKTLDRRVIRDEPGEDPIEVLHVGFAKLAQQRVEDDRISAVLQFALIDLRNHVLLVSVRQRRDCRTVQHAGKRFHGLRAGQIETLQQICPQFHGGERFSFGFDSLGHDQRADPAGKVRQGFDRLLLVIVAVEVADQGAVDLHHVGADDRNTVEIRMARADVVEHEQESAVVQALRQMLEPAEVFKLRFQHLDRDGARIESDATDFFHERGGGGLDIALHGSVEVQEQQSATAVGRCVGGFRVVVEEEDQVFASRRSGLVRLRRSPKASSPSGRQTCATRCCGRVPPCPRSDALPEPSETI